MYAGIAAEVFTLGVAGSIPVGTTLGQETPERVTPPVLAPLDNSIEFSGEMKTRVTSFTGSNPAALPRFTGPRVLALAR